MSEIPGRVTLQPDGSYIWSAELDMVIVRGNDRAGGMFWKIVALICFIAGIGISLFYRSWQLFFWLADFSIITVLITRGVFRGQESMGQRIQKYRLMDTMVSAGTGRGRAIFEFRKARVMVIGKNYIELKGPFVAFRAYIPEEDVPFVCKYIQNRVPKECEIKKV